jgi:hypothetical protein
VASEEYLVAAFRVRGTMERPSGMPQGEAYEGAATPEVLTKDPGRRPET